MLFIKWYTHSSAVSAVKVAQHLTMIKTEGSQLENRELMAFSLGMKLLGNIQDFNVKYCIFILLE